MNTFLNFSPAKSSTLSKTTQSLRQTLQLIVDILNFETSGDDLKQQLGNSSIDWDQIVAVASEHLVLPAVYCRLQQKSLLGLLPEDLVVYLKELTQLNRERNKTLLHEVRQISKLFEEHHIEYVLIKGTALLAGNYYKDIGERMIGDIDLLVASKDLDKAFDLLISIGYTQFLPFNYEVKNYRHRPRQISDQRLGAVELHDQLLKHHFNHLIDKTKFLSNKQIVDGIAVPNSEMLVWSTILAQQINDRCYYYNTLKLKGLYDILVLRLTHNKGLIQSLAKQKYSSGFLNLASIFCPEITPSQQRLLHHLKKRTYLLTLDFPTFGNQLLKLKSFYIAVIERLRLLFLNKSYRTHIFKNKLNGWIY